MLQRTRTGGVRVPMTSTQAMSPLIAEQAWKDYRSELVGFVRRRVGDEALADDIVHDVLVKAFSRLGSLTEPAKLRAWLYGITRNAITDHYRRRRLEDPLPEQLEAEGPEEVARAEQELARCTTPLLSALPSRYRDALILNEVEGLSQVELARRESLSVSGAKSRVQRARRMLREALLECCRVELDRRGGVVEYEATAGCAPCSASGSTGCDDGTG